MYIILVKY